VPVDEVLYSHGSTLHPYLLTYQLYTVEDSTHKRNQLQGVFFLGDQGTLNMDIQLFYCPNLFHAYWILSTFIIHTHVLSFGSLLLIIEL